jgi:hypothetical protein
VIGGESSQVQKHKAKGEIDVVGKPGRRQGVPGGHGCPRTVPIDAEQVYAPERCEICRRSPVDGSDEQGYTAHYTTDIIRPERGAGGLVPHQTKHVCLQRRCTYGTGRALSRHAVTRIVLGWWR